MSTARTNLCKERALLIIGVTLEKKSLSYFKIVHFLKFLGLLLFVCFFQINTPFVHGFRNSRENEFSRRPEISKAIDLVTEWSRRFGIDIKRGTEEVTCLRSIRNHYDPERIDLSFNPVKASVVSIDWTQTHTNIVKSISNTMRWHQNAVEAIAEKAELFARNHNFTRNLTLDYIDVHKLNDLNDLQIDYGQYMDNNTQQVSSEPQSTKDPSSEFTNSDDLIDLNNSTLQPETLPEPQKQTVEKAKDSNDPGVRYLKLNKHPNFGDVLINTDESAVHIPVHLYPEEENIMNGIYWSNYLTQVFRDNFIRNPRLTNQFFASQSGFLRLFPAQKWQVKRDDPDLYDARMRPWYVAGASSRKDIIILVDSSGSMTGSRRDIARGVVLEILDTLTDNDNFLVLKFSDTVQQVGVPICPKMQPKPKKSDIPRKNMLDQQLIDRIPKPQQDLQVDINSFYFLPANGRNVKHLRSNFSLTTIGIANFTRALTTAFQVIERYKNGNEMDSSCNSAIMLVTDGVPGDFSEIFHKYNYPNADVRVFTYLIGRDAGDIANTKMMACQNRGYYTHVINLAEVRETVQQYIPVMARPLVLNNDRPITWTPAYGELTYQILTDWVWESKRRDRARAILAASQSTSNSNEANSANKYQSSLSSTSSDDIYDPNGYRLEEDLNFDDVDLFGYKSDPNCFWQVHRNDLLTTVVKPVHDQRKETLITNRFLYKNSWQENSTKMRTANLLGVAAADLKINDIIALAPSHKLGPNAYAIILSNNGFAMHHPDLRPILEPFNMADPIERKMRILKPFFSSIDFTQVEHALDDDSSDEGSTIQNLRKDAVQGLTGWREMTTKRSIECQNRVQSRLQSFYYKPLELFPFSFIIAVPQPYGSHRIEAQIQVKTNQLPKNLTTYFTESQHDSWTIHPDYNYCDGPSNKSVISLLDMLNRIDLGHLDDVQWRASESSQPPMYIQDKIVCDKELVQSLVFDAVATYGFSENCTIQNNRDGESSVVDMYGAKFAFVATRSGLTRVRLFDGSSDIQRRDLLAFLHDHDRTVDETFYSRTVDYNMLFNSSSVVIQVPLNSESKIKDVLNQFNEPMTFVDKLKKLETARIYVIATQSIVINEGSQRAIAGVTGVFYNFGSFISRFYNSTNQRYARAASESEDNYDNEDPNPTNIPDQPTENVAQVSCGIMDDSIDCLLVDNNGFIIVSEHLEFIGKKLTSYEPAIMRELIKSDVYKQTNITDYQSICMHIDTKDKPTGFSNNILRPFDLIKIMTSFMGNLVEFSMSIWTILTMLSGFMFSSSNVEGLFAGQPTLSLSANKTDLRPCERTLSLHEFVNSKKHLKGGFNHYNACDNCAGWFVHEPVPFTNLIMLIVHLDPECPQCERQSDVNTRLLDQNDTPNEEKVCNNFVIENERFKRPLQSCKSNHADEIQIQLCGAADSLWPPNFVYLTILIITSFLIQIPRLHDIAT